MPIRVRPLGPIEPERPADLREHAKSLEEVERWLQDEPDQLADLKPFAQDYLKHLARLPPADVPAELLAVLRRLAGSTA